MRLVTMELCEEAYSAVQVRSHWPTAAPPMQNPYCSCRLTHVRAAVQRRKQPSGMLENDGVLIGGLTLTDNPTPVRTALLIT